MVLSIQTHNTKKQHQGLLQNKSSSAAAATDLNPISCNATKSTTTTKKQSWFANSRSSQMMQGVSLIPKPLRKLLAEDDSCLSPTTCSYSESVRSLLLEDDVLFSSSDHIPSSTKIDEQQQQQQQQDEEVPRTNPLPYVGQTNEQEDEGEYFVSLNDDDTVDEDAVDPAGFVCRSPLHKVTNNAKKLDILLDLEYSHAMLGGRRRIRLDNPIDCFHDDSNRDSSCDDDDVEEDDNDEEEEQKGLIELQNLLARYELVVREETS